MSSLDTYYEDDLMSPEVIRYRHRLEQAGVDTSRLSNLDLARGLVQQNQREGGDWDRFTDKYGQQTTDDYLDIQNAPKPGREGFIGGLKEIPAGFGRGYEGLKSTMYGAAGLTAGGLGFDGVEDAMMARAAEAQKRASEGGQSIGRATDVRWDRPSEVLRFLSGGFGEAMPSAIEAGVSFGAGMGVGGLAGRAVVKSKVKDAVAGIIKKKSTSETADQAIRRTFTEIGALTGVGASSLGMNIGEIYSELYQYTKLNPNDDEYISENSARSLALSFGTIAGALDFASAGTMLSQMIGVDKLKATNYLTRLVKKLPEGVFMEGATEGAQEFVIMAAEKYGKGKELTWTPDEINRMIDAGVLGAIGGTQFAAIGAVDLSGIGKKDINNERTDDVDLGEEPTFERDSQPELQPLDFSGDANPRGFKVGDKAQIGTQEVQIDDIDGGEASVSYNAIDSQGKPYKITEPVGLDLLSRPFDKEVIEDQDDIDEEVDSVWSKAKEGDKLYTSNGEEFTVEIVEGQKQLSNSDATMARPGDVELFTQKPATAPASPLIKQTTSVYGGVTYELGSIKDADAFNSELKSIEDEYTRRADLDDEEQGLRTEDQSNHAKRFREITGTKLETQKGQKIKEVMEELGVLDSSGRYAKRTKLDEKVADEKIAHEKGLNRSKLIRWSKKLKVYQEQDDKGDPIPGTLETDKLQGKKIQNPVFRDEEDNPHTFTIDSANIEEGTINISRQDGDDTISKTIYGGELSEWKPLVEKKKKPTVPKNNPISEGSPCPADDDGIFELLEDQELANKAVAIDYEDIGGQTGTESAIPVGGKRVSGHVGARGMTKEAADKTIERLKAEDQMTTKVEVDGRITSGFPDLRTESKPVPSGVHKGKEMYIVMWGEPTDSDFKDGKVIPELWVSNGRKFGYSEEQIQEGLQRLQKTPNQQAKSDPDPSSANWRENIYNAEDNLKEFDYSDDTYYVFTEQDDGTFNQSRKKPFSSEDELLEFFTDLHQRGKKGHLGVKGDGVYRVYIDKDENQLVIGNTAFELEPPANLIESGTKNWLVDELGGAGVIDLDFSDSFDRHIAEGGSISNQGFGYDQITFNLMPSVSTTKKLLVLRDERGQFRVMTAIVNATRGRKSIVKVYDSQLVDAKGKEVGEKSKFRPLKNNKGGKVSDRGMFDEDGWSLVGSIELSKPTQPIDIIVPDAETFLTDAQLERKIEKIGGKGLPVKDRSKGEEKAEKIFTRAQAAEMELEHGRKVLTHYNRLTELREDVSGKFEEELQELEASTLEYNGIKLGDMTEADALLIAKSIESKKAVIDRAVNQTITVSGKEYKVADVLSYKVRKAGLEGEWEAVHTDTNDGDTVYDAKKANKKLQQELGEGARKRLTWLMTNSAVNPVSSGEYVGQFTKDEPTYPVEVVRAAEAAEDRAISQSDQSGAGFDVGSEAGQNSKGTTAGTEADDADVLNTVGWDRYDETGDSNAIEAGSGFIELVTRKLDGESIGDSTEDGTDAMSAQHEQESMEISKGGKGGRWTGKSDLVNTNAFSRMLDQEGMSQAFDNYREAEKLISEHNSLEHREASELRTKLHKRIKRVEEALGLDTPVLKGEKFTESQFSDLTTRFNKIQRELAKELYHKGVKKGVVAGFTKKATAEESSYTYRTILDKKNNKKVLEKKSTIMDRTRPAEQKDVEDYLQRAMQEVEGGLNQEEVNLIALGDPIPIEIGDQIPDPQFKARQETEAAINTLVLGLNKRVESLSVIERATEEKDRLPDDYLGLDAMTIGVIERQKEAIDSRKSTPVHSLTNPISSVINYIISHTLGATPAQIAEDSKLQETLKDMVAGSLGAMPVLDNGFVENTVEQIEKIFDYVLDGRRGNFFNLTKADAKIKKALKEKVKPALYYIYGMDPEGNIVDQLDAPGSHIGSVIETRKPIGRAVNRKKMASDLYRFFGDRSFVDDLDVGGNAKPNRVGAVPVQHQMSSLGGIGGFTDFTNNTEIKEEVLITDEHSRQLELERAAEVRGAIASGENPMEAIPGFEENLAQGRAAISRMGQPGIPFTLGQAAVNHIIENISPSFRDGTALDFMARTIKGSKFMSNLKVRFVSWDEFRQYADTSGDQVSTAVFLNQTQEILVSDIFYTDRSISADEQLFATILHEAIHAPTKAALDVGYAYNNGIQIRTGAYMQGDTVKELGLTAKELGEVYDNIVSIIDEVTLTSKLQDDPFKYVHGLSSPYEFFSSLANREFREVLQKTNLSEKLKRKLGIKPKSWIRTAWDYVKSFMLRLVGLEAKSDLLKYADEQLQNVIELAQPTYKHQSSIMAASINGSDPLHMLVGVKGAAKLKRKTFNWYDGLGRAFVDYKGVSVSDIQIESFTEADPLSKVDARFDKMESDSIIKITKNGEELFYGHQMRQRQDSMAIDPSQYGPSLTIKDVINHPKLFEAYPELADFPVSFEVTGDRGASFDPSTREIVINLERNTKQGMYFDNYESSSFVESLFHEIQHAVDNIEGHPPGTSPMRIAQIALTLSQNPELFSLVSDSMGKMLADIPSSVSNTVRYSAFHLDRFIKAIRDPMDSLFGGDFDGSTFKTYKREMGEGTAAITSEIADVSLTEMGQEYAQQQDGLLGDDGEMPSAQDDDGLGPYKRFHTVMKHSWMMPRPSHLKKLEKYLLQNNPNSSQSLMTLFEILGELSDSSYTVKQESRAAQPDASEMVHKKAAAAAFNELEALNIQAYEDAMKSGAINMSYEDYAKKYGKVGNKNLETLRKVNHKGVENANRLRIGNEGKNHVMRSQGVRTALKWISNQLISAYRIMGDALSERSTYLKEQSELREQLNEASKGNLNSPGQIASMLKRHSLKRMTFEKLKKIFVEIDFDGLTMDQANFGDIDEQLLTDVLLQVSKKPDIENGTHKEIYSFLRSTPQLSEDSIMNRGYAIAVTYAIRNNRKGLIALLRIATDTSPNRAGVIAKAKRIANASKLEDIPTIEKSEYGSGYLENVKKMKERDLEINKLVTDIDLSVAIHQKRVDIMRPREKHFRAYLGEQEPVDISDGVTIFGIQRRRDDKDNILFDKKDPFEPVRLKVKLDRDLGIENRKEFDRIVTETLEFVRDDINQAKYGHELWFKHAKVQAYKAKMEPVGGVKENFVRQRRMAFLEELESLNMRFGRLGYEGNRIAGMLSQTQAIMRDLSSEMLSYAKRANVSVQKVAQVMQMNGQEVFDMWQEMGWFMDNEAQYAGAEMEVMFNALWKQLTKQKFVKDGVDAQMARRAVKNMLIKQIEARDHEARINKKLGNAVEDSDIKVISWLTNSHKDPISFYRKQMDLGYATFSRSLNDNMITSVLNVMDEQIKGFKAKNEKGEVIELQGDSARQSIIQRIKELANDADIEPSEQIQAIQQLMDRLYGGEVTQEFIEPYLTSGVRRTTFFGPVDDTGVGNDLGNSQVKEAWEASINEKDRLSATIESLYQLYNEKKEESPNDLANWYSSFAGQLHERYRTLRASGNRVAQQQHDILKVSNALTNTPRSLDARQVESRLPRKFFVYDWYDEVSTNIRLALLVTTSTFGRNGETANKLGSGYLKKMQARVAEFNTLMSRALGQGAHVHHEQPRMRYNRATKRAAYALLKERKIKDVKKYWDELYTDAVSFQDFAKAFDHLGKYYGHKNVAGPYQDANLLLEILGTQSMTVLNNPKSSFWQGMAATEFPRVFRGMNRMSKVATQKTVSTLLNNTFGAVLEGMGMQLPKMGRYAQNLNNTHFRMAEAKMDFRDYQTQIGYHGRMMGGEKTESMKKGLRFIKSVASHHKKNNDGTRAPVDLLSFITGIFPWYNSVVNHAVGTGMASAVEDSILRAAEYIEKTNMTLPREIDPEELGIKDEGLVGKYVVGEKDGWNNTNNMLQRSGLTSLSRLAFDYVQRKNKNPNAPVLEYQDVLMVNQAAMNNVSGEGFNAKPAFTYTNPFMRMGGSIFLGWPLFKMAVDNDYIFRREGDEISTYVAMMKYMGMVAAWYMPLGLAAGFMIDWYDEEVIGKPNNLPPLSPWALLPGIGVPMAAATDEQFTLYGVTSRLARAGNIYGMGFEVANSIFATGDPYGASREFSLDSRIFAFSMFRNIKDALGAWYHQGEADYGNVIRPIMYGLGGNSVIQQMDVVTNLLDIDIEEKRMAEYIGLRNYVKKTAWLMGLPLRPPSKGWGRPTPVSVNIRQMERAAYANDTQEFLKQYKQAVEAAKEYLDEQGRTDNPEEYIHNRFKQRNIKVGITQGVISDSDWSSMLNIVDSDVAQKLEGYMRSHSAYLRMIGGVKTQKAPMSAAQLRRNAILSQYY